jgi:hypothetical protein
MQINVQVQVLCRRRIVVPSGLDATLDEYRRTHADLSAFLAKIAVLELQDMPDLPGGSVAYIPQSACLPSLHGCCTQCLSSVSQLDFCSVLTNRTSLLKLPSSGIQGCPFSTRFVMPCTSKQREWWSWMRFVLTLERCAIIPW